MYPTQGFGDRNWANDLSGTPSNTRRMSGDHSATSADAIDGDPSQATVASERSDRWLERGRLVVRHWKSWLTAAALALAAWGLHGIGGWTLDTTAFAVAAVLVVGYRLVTLARDVRSL